MNTINLSVASWYPPLLHHTFHEWIWEVDYKNKNSHPVGGQTGYGFSDP